MLSSLSEQSMSATPQRRWPRPALRLALAGCALWLASCASAPSPPTLPLPFEDGLFAHGTPDHTPQGFDAQRLFELSDEMRSYAKGSLEMHRAWRDRREALIDALYTSNELQLYYDAGATRTAAETFAARSGNCLSLVLMTAAFAKHLGMPVAYQRVRVEDEYSRQGGLHFVAGHVNVMLGHPVPVASRLGETAWLTVDFLQRADLRGLRAEPIEEKTVVAMYLNNLAAEALMQGHLTLAYWRSREALRHDARFTAAANTLGVVYERAGHAPAAERAFAYVLARDERNTTAWANLARLLKAMGRNADAQAAEQRLAALQPVAPFAQLEAGRAALAQGDAATARDLFKRELRLQPFQHEVHFWLALAYAALGEAKAAAQHLSFAVEYSPGPKAKGVYSAKLQRLMTTRQ
jgi:tetratricopeptide (TPR) repeat protein